MIVTIDGPAGAGKSTVAKMLAEKLGFEVLDTGAMYRAVTWAAIESQIDWEDVDSLESLAESLTIRFDGEQVWVNDRQVTKEIRDQAVTRQVRHVANEPRLRRHLVEQQRQMVSGGNFVTEGRDQGSAAFPDAAVKFYLTATPEERANRRLKQLDDQGQTANFEELLKEQNDRDDSDRNRPVGPLVQPHDAIVIDSDGKTTPEVVDEMARLVQQIQSKA